MKAEPHASQWPDMEAEWSGDTFVVLYKDKYTGHGADGTRYLLDYNIHDKNPDGMVCNLINTDGTVCRLPRGHTRTHMSFSVQLAVVVGMYVVAIEPPGDTVSL